MSDQNTKEEGKKTGPEPARVKIKKDWKDAVADALKKPRPAGDWPASPKARKES
jgi:hypothetical protein